MDKPGQCFGCPFYQEGKGFVPDEIRPGARILLIAQNPGETDEERAQPLVGRVGLVVMDWAKKHGFAREQLSLANVIKCRWQGTNSLPTNKNGSFSEVTKKAARHCKAAYLDSSMSQAKANVTALLGELALNTVANVEGIGSWRGSVFTQGMTKFVATQHPSFLWSEPRMRTAVRQDFARIARESVLRTAPVVKYEDKFQQNVSLPRWLKVMQDLNAAKKQLSLDIETSYGKAIDVSLKTIGVAWSAEEAMNIDFSGSNSDDRKHILDSLAGYSGDYITATPFDYAVLTRYGVRFAWERCHDLTLLHSRFDIELPHTLEFIASMWTERAYWKYLNLEDPYRYNCLDCVAEYEAFRKLWTHCLVNGKGVLNCYNKDRMLEKVAVQFMLNGLPACPTAFAAEKAYYELERKELENEVIQSFSSPAESADQGGTSTSCERHPRYTGRTGVKPRKGETCPCPTCLDVRESYLSKQPLNLRSRTQLARKLKKEGMHVGASLDKGKLAAMAKKYSDPRLIRLLEFKRRDTICTRYFAELQTTKRTGRIHSTYSMHAAKHRWSSNGPNAQQFMRPEE